MFSVYDRFSLNIQYFALKVVLTVLLLVSLQSCEDISQLVAPVPTEPWLTPSELGIIANLSDPLSMQIAEYYQKQRNIPKRNIVTIKFATNQVNLSIAEFQQLKEQVDAQLPAYVQAIALTWASPYRVGCMSITSAFAFGFNEQYCSQGCQPTQPSAYFNSNSQRPYTDLGIRLTISIAATSFEQAKALIDRGIASDNTSPTGTAYLLSTSDKLRNVRASIYPAIHQHFGSRFNIQTVQADTIDRKSDVMFYFTGLKQVEKLNTNQFLPGAIADHLTSNGGMLINSPQMSSLRWLEAGATGSYGAVVEPCNFPQKFPNPGLVMMYYLNGETLLEAYWKSVAWPGEGIFIGEPLARPFGDHS